MGKTITLTLEVEREDGQYVSLCPELEVSSYGDSVEEALSRLRDAIALYLDTIEQDGDLERIFRDRRINVDKAPGSPHTVKVYPGLLATVASFPIEAA